MIQYSEKSKEVIKVEQILVQEKARLEQAKRKESKDALLTLLAKK